MSRPSREEDKKNHPEVVKLYSLKGVLGKGAFSVVRKAINRKTKEKVAIKVINKADVGKDFEKNLRMETEILKKVNHANIINLLEMIESPTHIYFVMELVTGGELFDRIIDKGSYSERDAATMMKKIVSAVAYLHDMNIAHRDLKPENLLVKSLEEDTEVKIADFGLSKIIGEDKMMQTACGTPGYVAPEILAAEGYDNEVDLWSIGVITYILLCGFPPFYSENVPEVFEQILNADYDYPGEYWDIISSDAKDFIDKLLVIDPKKRMSAKEALDHPWLNKDLKPGQSLDKLSSKLKNYVTVRRQQSQATQ